MEAALDIFQDLDNDQASDVHPFSGPHGRPVDREMRSRLARLSPIEEAVLRLRRGIGTADTRTPEALSVVVGLTRSGVRMVEVQAAFQVGLPSR